MVLHTKVRKRWVMCQDHHQRGTRSIGYSLHRGREPVRWLHAVVSAAVHSRSRCRRRRGATCQSLYVKIVQICINLSSSRTSGSQVGFPSPLVALANIG